jgi:hypothetical protein
VVTGYTVNNHRVPSVRRQEQRRIRSAAHELIREHAAGRSTIELTRKLRGRLTHLQRTNPGATSALVRQLAAAGISL